MSELPSEATKLVTGLIASEIEPAKSSFSKPDSFRFVNKLSAKKL